MSHVIYLRNGENYIKTNLYETLNWQNRICKIETRGGGGCIYFKVIKETPTTISGIRLQQDQYDNTKFYETDEKNKWHGIITDGSFSKGRWVYLYN